MKTGERRRETAKRLLVHYFTLVWQKAIVDLIFDEIDDVAIRSDQE